MSCPYSLSFEVQLLVKVNEKAIIHPILCHPSEKPILSNADKTKHWNKFFPPTSPDQLRINFEIFFFFLDHQLKNQ